MSKRAKIIIVVIAIVVIGVIAYFMFRKKKPSDAVNASTGSQQPNVITDPTNPVKVSWTENKFPLDVNMQGDYVLALQQALNRINPVNPIAVDGKFGSSTKTKLLLTVSHNQAILPMPSATWQQIIIDSHK